MGFSTNLSFTVYNLAEMKLETMAKRVEEKDKHTRRYNKNVFSISKQRLQLCFTRGLQSVKYIIYSLPRTPQKNFR